MVTWLILLAAAPALALVIWLVMRDWYLEWGATDLEILAPLGGDTQVRKPNYESTLAVTIHAEPGAIWPWIVQLGYRRGGLYSYDWLDRLFGYLDGPSAEEILPQFQNPHPGDVIPIGRGPAFPVTNVEPFRSLVMSSTADDYQWAWELELHRLGPRRTRLVSRNRVRTPHSAGSWLFMTFFLEPAAFLMTRKMLLGIKRRAEALERRRLSNTRMAA